MKGVCESVSGGVCVSIGKLQTTDTDHIHRHSME